MSETRKGTRMKARILKSTSLLVLILTSLAMAASPLGPPSALVGENQWAFGANVGFQSVDLEATGTYYEQGATLRSTSATIEIKDLQSFSSFLQAGLGLTDNWDVYACIGISDADADATVKSAATVATRGFSDNETFGISNNHDLAWGVGSRFTFSKSETVDWGGLFQMTWFNPKVGGSSWVSKSDPTYRINGDWDLDYWEIIVAIGPTIFYDNVTFYGGPFVQIVRGDLTLSGTYADNTNTNTGTVSSSQDLEEEAMVGAYAGMQLDLTDSTLLYMDGQVTPDAWGAGVGILFRH